MDSSDDDLLMLLLARRKRRNRKRFWVRPHFLLRETRGEYTRTFSCLMENKDEELFFNYMRMSYESFEELKAIVLPVLEPQGSNWRAAVSGEEQLVITLRHLATGGSFSSMSVPFHMSKCTIARKVLATCQVLWDVLKPRELPTPTEEQWRNIAKQFGDLWDFPFAIGALDGKHIALHNRNNSGSMYYNYKGFPSVVLMALSDADSCFNLVDCGQYGRISDAGVFNSSRLSCMLEEKLLNIPEDEMQIPSSDAGIPYLIIGDEAFPLKTYLMKPFAARTLDNKRRIYNLIPALKSSPCS